MIKEDERNRIYLNRNLSVKMPFLFAGKDPEEPGANFSENLLAEHDNIEAKQSKLPAAERQVILDYVAGFNAFIAKQKKDNEEVMAEAEKIKNETTDEINK